MGNGAFLDSPPFFFMWGRKYHYQNEREGKGKLIFSFPSLSLQGRILCCREGEGYFAVGMGEREELLRKVFFSFLYLFHCVKGNCFPWERKERERGAYFQFFIYIFIFPVGKDIVTFGKCR